MRGLWSSCFEAEAEENMGRLGANLRYSEPFSFKRERSQETEHRVFLYLVWARDTQSITLSSLYLSTLTEKTWTLSPGLWRPEAGESSHQKSGGRLLMSFDWRDHTPTVPSYEVETRKAWSHDIRILKAWSQKENIQRADDGFWIQPAGDSISRKFHAEKLRQKNMNWPRFYLEKKEKEDPERVGRYLMSSSQRKH